MAEITSLDFEKLLANTTNDIFDTMLSMRVEATKTKVEINKYENRIVGSVGFAGDVVGCMNIHVGDDFAKLIAGTMLGEDPWEVEEDDVLDVVGELRRRCLTQLEKGEIDKARKTHGMMVDISDALAPIHFPSALLPIRKKKDVVRVLVERTHGDLLNFIGR